MKYTISNVTALMKEIFQREVMFKKHGGIHCSMLAHIIKAYRTKIPAIISLTTFTSRSLEIAERASMTLGGYILKPVPALVNF